MQFTYPYGKLANGVEIPMVGFGTWQVPPGEEAVKAVAYALTHGYRSVDTAAAYRNEESVGEAIRNSGVDRKELFITTKLANRDQGYDSALKACETSLKKLGLDYADLYLIHWPGKDKFVESWKAFEKLYEQKLVRAIGVCNFLPHHFEELSKTAEIVPMVEQIEMHPYLHQKEAEEYAKAHGMLVEAWSPLMSGGEALKDPVITAIAEKYVKTPAQIILRYHYQMGRRPLPRSVTPSRIEENLDFFDFALNADEMKAIGALSSKEKRTGPHPDNFF